MIGGVTRQMLPHLVVIPRLHACRQALRGQIIRTWRFQQLFVYPSRTFWDKFSDGQFLWVRDMTSWEAGFQAIFECKYVFFQFLSTLKFYLVAKIMQNDYLWVIFHVKNKELSFFAVLIRFLILRKIQEGDRCWRRHRPPAKPPPIKDISSC